MNKPKRSIDAWGIGFAFVHQPRERMSGVQTFLLAAAVAAVILVVIEGVAWPL